MKILFSILLIAAIIYAAFVVNEKYIKSKPAAAAQSTTNPESTETVKAPKLPPASAASPDSVRMTCQTNVQAYDPNSPLTPLGWFKAGSELEVSNSKITGMKNVSFMDSAGKMIQAVCFEKDLNRPAENAAASVSISGTKSLVGNPNPTLIPQKQSLDEPNWKNSVKPNWHSIYDDPKYHMMTDKDGNQK